MSSTFFLKFGAGDPRQFAGLAPTFLIFSDLSGTVVPPPSIVQVGLSTGIYGFTYGVTTPLTFLADAATTSPGPQLRYVTGSIDPSDRIDQYSSTLLAFSVSLTAQGVTGLALGTSNVALGTTNIAYGVSEIAFSTTILASINTLSGITLSIGSTASSYGNDVVDPVDVFGYLKRLQELLEGNASFGRQNQTWDLYSRFSTTLLRSKVIGTDTVGVTKV